MFIRAENEQGNGHSVLFTCQTVSKLLGAYWFMQMLVSDLVDNFKLSSLR